MQVVLKDERQSQALLLKVGTKTPAAIHQMRSEHHMTLFCFPQITDYYYEERLCLLRCVLLLLTYFQDERHPYRVRHTRMHVWAG